MHLIYLLVNKVDMVYADTTHMQILVKKNALDGATCTS